MRNAVVWQATVNSPYVRHMFFIKDDSKEEISGNVDQFMDSYARNTSAVELNEVVNDSPLLALHIHVAD
jgi:hypothetical protein